MAVLVRLSGNTLVLINEVTRHRTGMGEPVQGSIQVRENLSQYIEPGQLSLAIPPCVGTISTSQKAVMPCGWGVKAGMVREWVAGRTV